MKDIGYGFRIMRRNPGFAAVAILTLALGIGANSAMFSVVNAVLLRPLPYPEPERLFALRSNESAPDLEEIRARAQSFEAAGGAALQRLDYTGSGDPVQVLAWLCDSEVLRALRVEPGMGRTISGDDDREGARPVVLLTDGFWRRQFAGDPGIVGKAIALSGVSYEVAGVLRPEFWKPGRAVDVLAPVRVASPAATRFRGVHFLETFLRLKPGAGAAAAQAEIDQINDWLAKTYPDENAGRTRRLMPLRERVVGDVRPALLILFGAVGCVLLVACGNYANLLLARAAGRQKEMVARRALGAGAGRLMWQMVAESIPLALCGGACGLFVAKWGVVALVKFKPAELPRLMEVGLDPWVLGLTMGVALLTGLVFGLFPAVGASRADVSSGLRDARGVAAGARTLKLRRALVVAEIALAVVLSIGAGLLIRSFGFLQGVQPGFRTGGVLTMRIELPESRYRELETQRRFRQRLLETLNAQPGLQAAIVSELPMSGESLTHNFVIDGRPELEQGREPELQTRTVEGDYFRVMGIPVRSGRTFAEVETQHVAVVNEAFVRRYFPEGNVLGVRIGWARQTPRDWMTVIGVVGDVRQFGPERPEEPAAYDLYSQTGAQWKRWMSLAVRSDAPPESVLAEVKRGLWSIDSRLPMTKVLTMNEVKDQAMARQRFQLLLMGLFAGVALLLAVVGIYGVMAYSVTQRTPEFGLRMALGAEPGLLLRSVTGESLSLAVMGGVIGMVTAFGFTRLMSRLLFGVSAHDPATFAGVAAVLAAVALAAAFFPALRAMRVDPATALRHE